MFLCLLSIQIFILLLFPAILFFFYPFLPPRLFHIFPLNICPSPFLFHFIFQPPHPTNIFYFSFNLLFLTQFISLNYILHSLYSTLVLRQLYACHFLVPHFSINSATVPVPLPFIRTTFLMSNLRFYTEDGRRMLFRATDNIQQQTRE